MEILADALLAMLAAIGIWTLGRMALDRLFAADAKGSYIWIVVRAAGDGGGLEQTVRSLTRRRPGPDVVLMDCGLNEQGRTLAERLTKQEPHVSLCPWEGLGVWMKEAEAWTRQETTTK